MKKYHCLLFAAFFGLISCEDNLNQIPISSMTTESFYRNENDFEQAVNGIYNALAAYPERQFYLSEVRSDNFYAYINTWNYGMINNFSVALATNDLVEEAWDNNYIGISRANTVLEKLSGTSVLDESTINQFEGEAKFLRALFYLDLVKYFGALPIIARVMTPTEILNVQRSPVSDVYELIISDLKDAIELLPGSYSTAADVGRATSHAAEGILAKVYITRSGTQLHPDGPCLGTDDYGEALVLLNDIINSGSFEMSDEYSSIFDINNENNAEIIFDIQYASGGLGVGATYPSEFAQGAGYWSHLGATWTHNYENVDVSSDLIDSYGNIDLRSKFNIIPGYIDINDNYQKKPVCVKFSKGQDLGSSRSDFGLNFPVLRYTDVLMMKAECILHGASGTQSEVDNIVNAVRSRAGLDLLSSVNLDQLLEERRKEFFGEGFRWHDLVRTGKVLDIMNEWIPVEDIYDKMLVPINSNHILYPVPQDEIDVVGGLYTQNEGY